MKLAFIYTFNKLKKNLLPTILSCFSISLIMCIIIISLNWSSFLKIGSYNYQRDPFGNTDIVVSIGLDTPDRFFSINESGFTTDQYINDKTDYIKSFFKTYGELQSENESDRFFSSIFVSDLEQLNQYNKISFNKGNVDYLARDEVIIGKQLATKMNLKINDSITINFGSYSSLYNVSAIAKDTGIFASSDNGNMLLLSPLGFKKIFPFYSEGIVTHLVLKLKDTKDIKILEQYLIEMAAPKSLKVALTIDPTTTQSLLRISQLPVNFIVVITLIFCLIALIILFRLLFIKDKNNFKILKNLGATKKQIFLIQGLIAMFIAIMAFILNVLIINILFAILLSVFPYINGASISISSYLISFFLGILISLFSTFLTNYQRKEKRIKQINYLFVSSLFSLLITLFLSVFITNLMIKLILNIIIIILIIYLVPILFSLLFKYLKQKRKLQFFISWNTIQHKNYQQIITFLLASCSIIVTMLTFSFKLKDYAYDVSNTMPYNILISNIKKPDANFTDEVSRINGVDKIAETSIYLSQSITGVNFKENVNMMAFKEEDLKIFFNDEEENINKLSNTINGAIIGQDMSLRLDIKVGDIITTSIGINNYTYEIVGFLKSDFYLGNFMITNLKYIATLERPYTNLVIYTNGNISNVINNLYSIYKTNNLFITNIKEFQLQWYTNSMIFINFMLFLSTFISLLIFITLFLLFYLWHNAKKNEYEQLHRIGISNRRMSKHNTITLLFNLCFTFLFLIIIVNSMIEIFNATALLLKIYQQMLFNIEIYLSFIIFTSFILILLDKFTYLKNKKGNPL